MYKNKKIILSIVLVFLATFVVIYKNPTTNIKSNENIKRDLKSLGKDNKTSYIIVSDNKKISKNENEKYQIGSQTKMFTAALIHKLIDQNKLKLNDSIKKIFKNSDKLKLFTIKGINYENLTVEQLLNHHSNLPDFINLKTKNNETVSDLDVVKKYKKYYNKTFNDTDVFNLIDKYTFKNNNKQLIKDNNIEYSNTAYYVLGMIIAKTTNLSLDKAYDKYIFKPLNMKDTLANSKDLHGNAGKEKEYMDVSMYGGAGCIVSTANDLYKWMKVLNKNDNKLMSKSEFKKWETQSDKIGNYGQGRIEITDSWYGHIGQSLGFGSWSFYDKKNDSYLIFGINNSLKPLYIELLSIIERIS